MTVTELFDLFRSDVGDDVPAYLWSDDEVYSYMDDAFKMFARLTGGIPDSTSDITRVDITTGEEYSTVSPKILKFREAFLESSGQPLRIINNENLGGIVRDDYGSTVSFARNRPGRVTHMAIGLDRTGDGGQVRWVGIPQADDVALLTVYRLPLTTLNESANERALYEIGEEHHVNLLPWMRYRAYAKDDSETLDKGQSLVNRRAFEEYCTMVKAENERYKSKTRVVAYGGL
jgi:hypothetical protein